MFMGILKRTCNLWQLLEANRKARLSLSLLPRKRKKEKEAWNRQLAS